MLHSSQTGSEHFPKAGPMAPSVQWCGRIIERHLCHKNFVARVLFGAEYLGSGSQKASSEIPTSSIVA